MSEWIDTEKELPPCDGIYWVANNICSSTHEERLKYDATLANYDGFGFIPFEAFSKVYRNILFWKPYITPEKRYGKVEK